MVVMRFLILILCFCSINLSGQLSESAQISVLTCRPGSDVYNMFGHSAIRVQDSTHDIDEIYNYGIFDFKEPNFLSKFLRGKLLYKLGVNNYQNFIRNYSYEKRSVIEQVLDLDQTSKNNLFTALRNNYKPENRNYLYDFFFDNCSTRIMDQFALHIDEVNLPIETEDNYTHRELLDQFTYPYPWRDFGIDLLIGSIADRQATVAEQSFLPAYLYRFVERSSVRHRPLVSAINLVADHEADAKARMKTPWFLPVYLFIILLVLEVFLFFKYVIKNNRKKSKMLKVYDNLLYSITGIAGLLLLFMWFGTDHMATKLNYNVVWMHPLFLFILFMRNRYLIMVSAFLLIVGLILGSTIQSFHIASIVIIVTLVIKLARNLNYALNTSQSTI